MVNYFSYPYARPEQLERSYIIATYVIYGTDCSSVLEKAGNFAVGQTIGTWVPVPGISPDMIERYQGRIVALYPVAGENEQFFILRLAFPQKI